MDCFPTDLLQEIFIRLPCKNVGISKCVCTSWYDLLSDQSFTANYAANSPITTVFTEQSHFISNPPSLFQFAPNGDLIATRINPKLPGNNRYVGREINSTLYLAGTGNGLVFLMLRTALLNLVTEKIYFFNPFCKECVQVAENRLVCPEWNYGYKYMIDYVPEIKSYKIVRFTDPGNDKPSQAKIFAVGIDHEWRILDDPLVSSSRWSNRVSFRGFCHWVSVDSDGVVSIRTLGLSEEKFTPGIRLPRELTRISYYEDRVTGLRVFNDRLSLVDRSDFDERITIWTMEEYGIADSWSKIVVQLSWLPIDMRESADLYHALTILPNGNVVLSLKDSVELISVCIEKKQATKIRVPDNVRNRSTLYGTAFAPRFYPLDEDRIRRQWHNRKTPSAWLSTVSIALSVLVLALYVKRFLDFVYGLFR
ncbi:PREDICTED: F-box/kelch-repeat protein At3g23880-like [Erythranthe guttata]|uniref:F-box/kelch-repeat protein At3g23880-like n=1 Tax=Erythranthe guttata TaxID=4155 RepID=UPI00064D95A1|nr:PREDICTED: F-box/kelch-repeat protein At3g23880-like [Erythranthe guttata]|eukprot:XP_012837299.1 PREDICTED: F-box/kelch-repeat protein At3g23880-like [Erythranthe guttata]